MSSAKKTGSSKVQNSAQKRRNRRKKAQNSYTENETHASNVESESKPKKHILHLNQATGDEAVYYGPCNCPDCCVVKIDIGTMTNDPIESREKIKAAREAKKLAKQQAKLKRDAALDIKQPAKVPVGAKKEESSDQPSKTSKDDIPKEQVKEVKETVQGSSKELAKETKSSDEVDRATAPVQTVAPVAQEIDQDKERIKAERAAKKTAKQAKKKISAGDNIPTASSAPVAPVAETEMTVRDVVQTLRDIKVVAQEIKGITDKVQALNLDKNKPEKKTPSAQKTPVQEEQSVLKPDVAPDTTKEALAPITTPKGPPQSEEGKSKAELKAERRAKQEAQRAAKEAAAQAKAAATKPKEQIAQPKETGKPEAKEKSPKPKTVVKQTAKQQGHKVNWFRHLYNEDDKAKLNKLPINSNLHPAIIKLGVQLATRVVTGSNARCIALLDALKKMVRDYSLPAKTEFGRGLEAHLATSLEFLWSMRQPAASQTNAVKFFRHHLTQLPNNVDEFDAKKTLQEEIDRYIREQIDMAGEAISITVRNKISTGDIILTYGCSSLIERILAEAHAAGVQFRAVVCGGGVAARGAREMTRRLAARGVPVICVDITALGFIMRSVNKVLLGAHSLLANGSVLACAGTATAALTARAYNKPVLVACETHKFSERVQTDAFVYNEIGDPDDLIDKSDENSPLKDWRSNPNLTPLNLMYDVTPPHLITAVVTELAILPCTSAPVVLRFKLSEYSI